MQRRLVSRFAQGELERYGRLGPGVALVFRSVGPYTAIVMELRYGQIAVGTITGVILSDDTFAE